MACTRSVMQHKRSKTSATRALAGFLALLSVGACGSLRNPPPKDPEALEDYKAANDPYEPLNRKMFLVNMVAYKFALRPMGKAWRDNVPKFFRTTVDNVNETWGQPSTFFSDVGAGKPRRAGDSFMRFLINMSAGVAGFFDVASFTSYKNHTTDPGMTMGVWGIKSGPYVFLPGIGPSNFRDSIGYALGQALVPINYVPSGYGLIDFNWAYNILGDFNNFSNQIDQLDQLEHQSLDPYAFMRSAWQQKRQGDIDALKADNRATVPDWY